MPRCSVAIPVFNREKFIASCVRSVFTQELSDLEILVVDNQSTDRTWEILQDLHREDSRLRLSRNDTNLGMFGNFNRALHLATGDTLCLLCSDDRLLPGFLTTATTALEQNPELAVFSGRGKKVDENGRFLGWTGVGFSPGVYPGEWAAGEILRFLAATAWNPLNYPSGILLRRSAARVAGEFNPEFPGVADVDFLLRALRGGDLLVSDAATCEISVHSGQAGKSQQVRLSEVGDFFQVAETWRSILERRGIYAQIRRDLASYALLMGAAEIARGDRQLGRDFVALSARVGAAGWLRRSMGALAIAARHQRVAWGKKTLPVRPPAASARDSNRAT